LTHLAGALSVLALAASPANAVTFVLTNTGGAEVGTQARAGFDLAAAYWSSVLTNNVTINLNIGFRTLGTGILGSTGSTSSVNFNSQVYNALANAATSEVDRRAVTSLQPLGVSTTYGLNVLTMTTNAFNAAGTGYVDTATRRDNDGSINNVAVAVNTSVDKALGITTDANGRAINYALADGSITFSNTFNFDFDPLDGVASNAYDFVGVATHEIGHALGFRSGVDTYDAYTSPGATNVRAGALEGSVVGTEFDYWRYTADGKLDWSTQGDPYFSIDGGASQVLGDSLLSKGVSNGDGRQASHWLDSAAGLPQLGILDPTSGLGQMQEITALDLAAFDALGWTTSVDALANPGYRFSTADIYRSFAAAVPEPGTWAQMVLGVGLMGGSLRYRRRRTAVRFA
jgi:cation transport regulator ChaB